MNEDPKTKYDQKIANRAVILIILLSMILAFNLATCSLITWLIYLLIHG